MKRSGLILFFLLASLFLGGSAPRLRVHSLKLVSKADMEVGVQLVELEQKRAYYFLMDAAGTPSVPIEATYAIEQGIYTMSIYYIEAYDPVYGDWCEDPGSQRLYMNRDMEVVIRSCNQRSDNQGDAIIRNKGENPPKIKIGTVDSKKDMRESSGPGPN